MTARGGGVRADWIAALARFREAARALDSCKARNPYPCEDQLPDNYDADATDVCFAEWERSGACTAGATCAASLASAAFVAPE